MPSVNVRLRPGKPTKRGSQVQVLYQHKSEKPLYFFTEKKFFAFSDQFDPISGRLVEEDDPSRNLAAHPQAKMVNPLIDSQVAAIWQVVDRLNGMRQEPTRDRVDRLMKASMASGYSAVTLAYEYMRDGSIKKLSDSTVKSRRAIVNKLTMIERILGRTIYMSDFDASFADEIYKLAVSDQLSERIDKLTNSSILQLFNSLKMFVNWAIRKSYIESSNFHLYEPPMKAGAPGEKPHLTDTELFHLFDFDMSNESSTNRSVRDSFCFLCFTGRRWVEVFGDRNMEPIKMEHISNQDGKWVWTMTARKSGKRTKILLPEIVVECIKRQGVESGPLFKPISHSHYCKVLRLVALAAGLDRPHTVVRRYGSQQKSVTLPLWRYLTSHCGRVTFSNYFVDKNFGSAYELQRLLGHSNIQTTMNYLRNPQELKIQEGMFKR